MLHDSWRVYVGVLDGWVHLTRGHVMWCMMTSEDGTNGLTNGFWWTDRLWKVGNFFDRWQILLMVVRQSLYITLWCCLFADRLCSKFSETCVLFFWFPVFGMVSRGGGGCQESRVPRSNHRKIHGVYFSCCTPNKTQPELLQWLFYVKNSSWSSR